MQRIIIEAPGGKELTSLVQLLRRLDFVRSVRLEPEVGEPTVWDKAVEPGKPMSMEEFLTRIQLAEAEDETGLSIPDEELKIDF